MKKIKLTQNKFALVDDEDYEKLNQYSWYAEKGRYTYYAARTDKLKKKIRIHRFIMNPTSNLQIDHINGNGLDNRKENLRICTHQQNQYNKKLSKNNSSGIKGVHWDKSRNKWRAKIKINNKEKYLGRFKDRIEAKEVYTKFAKQYFGEFYSDGKKHLEVLV
jgi:hypothetical protein